MKIYYGTNYNNFLGEDDQLVNALTVLKERAESDEPNSLFALCNDLSKVSCRKSMT